MFVYMIICDKDISKVTGIGKYYIGKTISPNLDKYFKKQITQANNISSKNKKPHLYNAFRKYGAASFRIFPLISWLETDEQIKEWEIKLIRALRSQDTEIGYNISAGGDGVTMTPEIRRKIGINSGAARKGKPLTKECVRKLTEIRKKRYAETGKLPFKINPENFFKKGNVPPIKSHATRFKEGAAPWNKNKSGYKIKISVQGLIGKRRGALKIAKIPREKIPEIVALREQGWTLSKLGDKYGVSFAQIHNIVTGKRRVV